MDLDALRGLATWGTFWLLTGVQLVLLAGFWLLARAREKHSREPTLDGRNVGYTPEQAFAAVERYGPAGRRLYVLQLTWLDLAYPVVYAGWLAVGMGLALKGLRAPAWTWVVAVVPFLGALVDYLENLCIIILLWRVPGGARPRGVAQLASRATVIKWMFAYLSLGLVLLLGAAAAIAGWLR